MTVVRRLFLVTIAAMTVLPLALLAIHPTPPPAGDVCDRLALVLRDGDWRALERLSPEQRVAKYDPRAAVPHRWRLPTSGSFPELATFQLWDVSRVDLDNDGRPDVRYTGVAGTAACQTTYVFAQTGGDRYRVLFHENGEARICGGDHIAIVADRGINYVAWYSDRETAVRVVLPTGAERPVCRIKRTLDSPRMTSVCDAPACQAAARSLASWKGPAEETIGIPGSDPAVARQTTIPGHAMADGTERLGLLVDVDNDGPAELVTIGWHGPRWGYLAEIFVRTPRGYEAVKARTRWPGWPEHEDEGLVFVGADRKTYTVALTKADTDRLRGRTAVVYLVESARAREIGRIRFMSSWRVTVERPGR